MYSIICLFPCMPHGYDYRDAAMKVFNITTDQLVSVRKQRENNTVIFTVASQEIFNSLSEFYCRILFFPMLDHNILECFAYPKSPQYQFLKLSANSVDDIADAWDAYLSGFGMVLYRRYLCGGIPLMSGFRTDTIGVVLLVTDQNSPFAIQLHPGDGQEAAATAMPNVPPAGASTAGDDSDEALLQLLELIESLHNLATAPPQSDRASDDTGADLAKDRNYPPWIGLPSPDQEPVKEKAASQEPSPKETPAAEDKNPKPSTD